MEGISPSPSATARLPAVRSLELAAQLRAAIMEGDDARLARLLSDLLRVKGLTKGQRVGLQLRTIMSLVQSLRSATLNDELTGLLNRRGFMQIGTRLLDLASRDEQIVHLIYLRLDHGQLLEDATGRVASDLLIRRMGNFMRDLFPSYGVYEVLGRLSGHEFAALTPACKYVSPVAILQRARCPEGAGDIPALPLTLGIAQFDPARPIAVEELLRNALPAVDAVASAAVAADAVAPASRIASPGLAPQPGMTLC
jgi:diguanylate cyclase (GGDEF)-like protein